MDLRLALVPVGRVEAAEIEAVAVRLAKVFNHAIELRDATPVPKAGDDPARGQHLAAPFLAALRGALPRLGGARQVGGHGAPVPVPAGPPDLTLFVTDVDLYRPQTDGVFGEIDAAGRAAALSVRRLRESFYRRPADPARQRARVVKLALFAAGRIRGLPDCRDPQCAMSAMAALADLDARSEKYCAACWKRLSTGAYRI